MSELHYEVLVNDGVRRHREQTLPDGSPIISSPVASTLIYGERDAVLVDPPFTYEQVARVGDWIERSGKHLKAVYATHGHGDHWFGTDLLLQRFPGAVGYATEGTIAMMHQRGTVGRAQQWDVDFPGLIPPSPVVYQPIPDGGIELEGHRLLAVEVGHTDTDDTTVLHVPSIGLVVAGDVVYNGVHQYLLESADGGVDSWLAALDKVAALEPRAVVAGHKNKELPDDPAILQQTRDYLLDSRRLIAKSPTPQVYFDQMIALYPDRLNVGPVWYTAVALLSEPAGDAPVVDEVTRWFFDDYLPTWVDVCAGTTVREPEFILDYWSAPLSMSTEHGGRWMADQASVVAMLHELHERLRTEGYTHTVVADRRVSVYNVNGAAIDVIWSRRRADEAEIERVVIHFELQRRSHGWRIIGIQQAATASGSLETAWAPAP